MPWTWRYEKADGSVITTDELQEAIFASQGDAESWLGENWRALLSAGVDQVLAAQRQQNRVRPDEPAPGELRTGRRLPRRLHRHVYIGTGPLEASRAATSGWRSGPGRG